MNRLSALPRWAIAAVGLLFLLAATLASWRWYAGMQGRARDAELTVSEGLAALRELPALMLEREELARRVPPGPEALNAASLLEVVNRAAVGSGTTVTDIGTMFPAQGPDRQIVIRLVARGTVSQVTAFIDALAAAVPGRMEDPVLVWRGAVVDLAMEWRIPMTDFGHGA